jgi:hypothetical protein
VFPIALALAACAPVRPEEPLLPAVPAATTAWPDARDAAHEAVQRAAYGRADSVLAAFALAHASSAEAADALYLRAVLQLDPANPAESRRDALAALDAYVSGGPSRTQYVAAGVLRRLLRHEDSVRAVVPAAAAAAAPDPRRAGVSRDSLRVRDEELARLRTELEETRTELDRLRRLLAAPRPRRP